jgi:hypothetical protein
MQEEPIRDFRYKIPKINDLKPIAIKMAKYIKENGIELVVVPGTSAQSAAYMVRTAWKTFFPNVPMPTFIALGQAEKKDKWFLKATREGHLHEDTLQKGNPKKVVPLFAADKIEREKMRNAGHTLVQIPLYFSPQTVTVFPKIAKQLRARIKGTPKRTKIFILEESTIDGITINFMKKTLQRLGYCRIKTGTLFQGQPSNYQPPKLDFVGSKGNETMLELHGERRQAFDNMMLARAQRTAEKKLQGYSRRKDNRKKLKKLRTRLAIR